MKLSRTGRTCDPTIEMSISKFKAGMANLARNVNVLAAEIVGEFIRRLRGHGRILGAYVGDAKIQSKEAMKLATKRITKSLRNFSKEILNMLQQESKNAIKDGEYN